MLCHLSRWLISRAEDRGKSLPRFAGRHVERCAKCREYARFAASLSSRFSQETQTFLASVPDFSLSLAGQAAGDPGPGKRRLRLGRLALRPLPAVAAAVVVAASALFLFRVVPRPASLSPLEREKAMAAMKTVTAAPAQFQGILEGAEASLAKERAILEESVLSAVEYLQARLNIKIERREDPKPL